MTDRVRHEVTANAARARTDAARLETDATHATTAAGRATIAGAPRRVETGHAAIGRTAIARHMAVLEAHRIVARGTTARTTIAAATRGATIGSPGARQARGLVTTSAAAHNAHPGGATSAARDRGSRRDAVPETTVDAIHVRRANGTIGIAGVAGATCVPAGAIATAEGRAIGAKGLTGPGYEGHTFWDAETFVLPVLTYTAPEAAAWALRWRHETLDLARDRAAQLGLAGAAFPWRTIRGHECSGYWPAGTAAFHVNADMMETIQRQLPAGGRAGEHRIGYWFWELAHFPLGFAESFRFVDEVWAPSRFCLEAFRPLAPVPVRGLPTASTFLPLSNHLSMSWLRSMRNDSAAAPNG